MAEMGIWGFHSFPKGINIKMNEISRLEFELTYCESESERHCVPFRTNTVVKGMNILISPRNRLNSTAALLPKGWFGLRRLICILNKEKPNETTSPSQSGSGSNRNEFVLYTSQISNTGASPSNISRIPLSKTIRILVTFDENGQHRFIGRVDLIAF